MSKFEKCEIVTQQKFRIRSEYQFVRVEKIITTFYRNDCKIGGNETLITMVLFEIYSTEDGAYISSHSLPLDQFVEKYKNDFNYVEY